MADINLVPGDTLVKITNMTGGMCGYILDSGVRRKLSEGASMNVTADELRQLSYRPGGEQIITNYLRIDNHDLAIELGVPEDMYEHEYQWDKAKVKSVLLSTDATSMDELKDALDFAPDAIKDMIVSLAVELEIPDVNKRKAIQDATGSDVSKMIEVKNSYHDADGTDNVAPKTRRTSSKTTKSSTTTAKTTRRTTAKSVTSEA